MRIDPHPFTIFTENPRVWITVYGASLAAGVLALIGGYETAAFLLIVGPVGSFVLIGAVSLFMWFLDGLDEK